MSHLKKIQKITKIPDSPDIQEIHDITDVILNGRNSTIADVFAPHHLGCTLEEWQDLNDHQRMMELHGETISKIDPVENMALYRQDEQFFDISIHDMVLPEYLYRWLIENRYISFFYSEAPKYLKKLLKQVRFKRHYDLDGSVRCVGSVQFHGVSCQVMYQIWNESEQHRIEDHPDPIQFGLDFGEIQRSQK